MKELVLLYWGSILLIYLSQIYYPEHKRLEDRHTSRRNFLWGKPDVFLFLVILLFLMTN